MLVTTTHSVEGRRIVEYKGIRCREAILGANLFRDLFASIRDIVWVDARVHMKRFVRRTADGDCRTDRQG